MKTHLILACTVAVTFAFSAKVCATAPQNRLEPCKKSISFAIAGPGGVVPRIPKFARQWVRKNAKKYPGLCFSQNPQPNIANYLLVFSASRSAFLGFTPTVRTKTITNESSVSGSGAVNDNRGNTWFYTYDGTTTTTTRTSSTENVPYLDTTRTLYLYAYDQHGKIISDRERSITTRQGGDPESGALINVGALIKAHIDTKGRLMGAVVKDVSEAPNDEHLPRNPLKDLFSSPEYFRLPLDQQVAAVFKILGPRYESLPQKDKEDIVRDLNQRYLAKIRGEAVAQHESPYLGVYQPSPELREKLRGQQEMRAAPGGGPSPGQHEKRSRMGAPLPLTNGDISEMIASGLSPDVVIAKIESSSCNFDTSPRALEGLRRGGVPNPVILAMVKKVSASK